MASRYFYGGSVKSNRVKSSPARTFPDLVKRHLDTAVPLRVTRADYNAIPTDTKEGKAERLTAKDTTYLVACVFEENESSRERQYAMDCCNLLFLDLDTEKDGKCPAAPFVANPSILLNALKPLNFAAYTTASSTTEKPRMRIVVDADGITLDDYPKAVRAIAERIGLKQVTRESLTPNQPMICPSMFMEEDPDTEHPMVVSFVKGRAFTSADLPDSDNDLPGTESKTKETKTYGEDDGLEYLRAPLEGATLGHVTKALHHLSPDMPYPEWFEICCALKHQFSNTEEEEAAYSLFDKWSENSTKYVNEEDTRAKWDNVKPTPRCRTPVTIRTLIKRAHDAGFDAGEVKNACFQVVNDWINSGAKTMHDMMHTSLQKIASLPVLTATEEGLLLQSVVNALGKLGEKAKVADLKKDLNKIKNVKTRVNRDENAKKDPAWVKGWYFVAEKEEFFRPSSHQWRSPNALNAEYSRFLLPTQEALEEAGRDPSDAALYNPILLPQTYLLNKIECPVVDATEYDPASPKEIYSEDANGLKLVNTYRACYPKANLKDAQVAGDIFIHHLENLITEPEYRRFVLDYIAFMVQNPGKKIRFSILIQGAEGCGKSFMARVLGTVLGEENVMYVNNEAIRGNWNEWAIGAQATVIGEIRISGHNRHDVMNKLKDLVTDDFVSVNRKNLDTRKHKNVTNYFMFTNHHDALAVMSGSRRYFVIKSPLQTEEQVLALGTDYFPNIFGMLDKYAGGLRSFFETWEISPSFDPNGRAPKTKYLEEMIEDSADPTLCAIRKALQDEESPLVQKDLVWFPAMSAALSLEGINETPHRLGKLLREEHYTKVPGRPLIDGARGYVWVRQGHHTGRTPEHIFNLLRQRAGEETEEQEDDDFC